MSRESLRPGGDRAGLNRTDRDRTKTRPDQNRDRDHKATKDPNDDNHFSYSDYTVTRSAPTTATEE